MSGQSFAEKYRGTEWETADAAAQAAPAAPAAPAGRPPEGSGTAARLQAVGSVPAHAVAPLTSTLQSVPSVASVDGAPRVSAVPGGATVAGGSDVAPAPVAGDGDGAVARHRRRPSRTAALLLLAAGGIAVSVATGAGLALAGVGGSGPTPGAAGLAGVAGLTTMPGASAPPAGALEPGTSPAPGASSAPGSQTGPAASGAPAASAAPGGTSVPAATETPAQAGRRVLAAFDALMLVPGISYRLEGKGTAKSNQGTLSWTRNCTVVGASNSCRYVEKTTIKGYAEKLASRTVVVGLRMWAKFGTKDWLPTRAAGAFRYSPFLDIVQAREFTYKGTVTRRGARLHRLVSNADYHPSITKWGGVTLRGVVLSKPSMELLLADDGTPVSARFTYRARGGGLRVEGTADWAFSDVGSKSLKVTPPN